MKIKHDVCQCGEAIKYAGPRLCGACYQRQWKVGALGRTFAKKSETIGQRFYQRFHPEPNSGCWLWSGTMTRAGGYGELVCRGKKHRAHVLSYKLHNGPVPTGLCVLHRCDVPRCVNPNHLFIGTNLDNVRDRDAKGRGVRKLTEEQVIAIRKMGGLQRDIAARFDIGASTVRDIKSRKTWAWLEAP